MAADQLLPTLETPVEGRSTRQSIMLTNALLLVLLSPVAMARFAPSNLQAGAFDEDFNGIVFDRAEGGNPMVLAVHIGDAGDRDESESE